MYCQLKGRMPFFNNVAWNSTQHTCNIQRCTYAHLSKRTRPSGKAKTDVRRYLQIASVSNSSLLVLDRINNTKGHLYASDHQLSELSSCYFCGTGSETAIKSVAESCANYNSKKYLPK